MATWDRSDPLTGTLLRGALSFAWYRGSAVAGTHHLLPALVASGDPVSSQTLAESGVTYRAVCGVLDTPSGWEDGGSGTASGQNVAARVLADASGGIRLPGRLARLLGRTGSKPRWPLPAWSRNVETVVAEAARSAQTAGRDEPCRADLTLALLSKENGAASEVLERLGVDRERLRHHLAEALGPEVPAPTSSPYSEIRNSGWVLGFLLAQGTCSLPGRHDSIAWRMGLMMMTLNNIARVRADLEVTETKPEHVLLAIIAAYEDLAADHEQFGPGWEACFPAGRALAGYGITYERAREVTLALSTGTEAGDLDGPHGFFDTLRRFVPFAPTQKDGSEEAVRLLGHRPRGKGAMTTPEVNLLGVMHEKNESANRILGALNVDRERLRNDLIAALR